MFCRLCRVWHHRAVIPTTRTIDPDATAARREVAHSRQTICPRSRSLGFIMAAVVALSAWPAPAQSPTPDPEPVASPTATATTAPTPAPTAPATPTAVPPPPSVNDVEQVDPEQLPPDTLADDLDGFFRELRARAENVAPGSEDAATLDRELREAILLLHGWTRSALQAWYDVSSSHRRDTPTPARDPEVAWSRLSVLEQHLDRLVALVRFNRPNLPEAYQNRLIGLGAEGRRELALEVDHLALKARLYKARRLHDLDRLPERVADLPTIGELVWHLLVTLIAFVAAVFLRRRGPDGLERIRQAAFRSFDSLKWKRRVVRLTNAAEVLLPWGSFALGVVAVRWALGPLADEIEIDVVLRLALLYGLYRLAIDATAGLFLAIGRHYKLRIGDEQQRRLERSVRTVMRIAGLLLIIGLVSARWLGKGVLYDLVSRFAWVIILIAILTELFRWRTSMVDAFLELSPDGPLAASVRDSRDHWYGIFIAPAAFVWLAFHGLTAVARDFMLRFDETQKALAFLFRRKVEKQAEREGYADEVYDDVPAEVLEAFDESAVDRGPLVVAHFPELEALQKQVSEWRRTGIGGAAVVQGERGIGKTSWLNQLRREDVQITRIELGTRVTDPQTLVEHLARKLEMPDTPASLEELAERLESGDQRIIVLDLAQHLFIARIGGYDAFGAFAELVNRTRQQVFWLASMSKYAWHHLHAVHPDCAVFQRVIPLDGWSEEEIRELIQRRTKASGAVFNYADVAVDHIEGVASRARFVESAEGYLRLLWDYSGGNPRIALHFFVRSLDPDHGGRLRVRLFRAPDPTRLEAGGEAGLFVLAAIVTHESLSIEDLATVTRSTVGRCHIHVDRLIDLGAARVDDGLIRVTTTWQRAAVRLLRRRNLLPD